MDQCILEQMYSTSYNVWIGGHLGYSDQEEINAYLTGLSNIMHIQLIMYSIYGISLTQL